MRVSGLVSSMFTLILGFKVM